MKDCIVLFCSLLLFLNLAAQPDCYDLIWQDEFSGTQLDPLKWGYQNGTWGGNSNVQNCYVPQNTSVSNGSLKIEAKYEPGYQCFANTRDFTSGSIRTKNIIDWTFGYFEARVKVPASNSTWPAFWMSPENEIYGPWPRSGEIDIFEIKGHDLSKSYGTAHWGNAANDRQQDKGTYAFPNGTDASSWHTYGVEWELGALHFYIDGNHYHTINNFDEPNATTHPGPFDAGFYLRLNMAVGGNYLVSPWNDANNGIAQLPAIMEVDWVRVYELNNICDDNANNSGVCNLLENGNFQNGTTAWSLSEIQSASGNINVEPNGFCKVDVINPSSSAWHLALRQTGLLLEQGETYEVSFTAYADANRSVALILSDASGAQYHFNSENLTTTAQDFVYTFIMNQPTDSSSNFSFNVGNENVDVYVDDIMIKKLNCINSGCENTLNISNAVATDATYNAAVSINCDATIDANVDLRAGQEIVLTEGFQTNINNQFTAYIEDCNSICDPSLTVDANSTIAYQSITTCGVSEGISGMWVSRNNPNVYWHIADKDVGLHPDNHYLFAVSSTGNLLWSGELSGVNAGDKDLEAITGYEFNGTWYLALWENHWDHDEIQIIAEPTVSENQTLAYGVTLPVQKIITPQGGIGSAGNVESLVWDEYDDNMYLVQRGGAAPNVNPTQAVWRIPNFSFLADGATPNEIFVANIQGRPDGIDPNIHIGVGDAAITTDGDVFLMIGIGGSGVTKNEYMFWWTRDPLYESWADVFSNNPIPDSANSLNTSSMGENVALYPNTSIVLYGNDWASGANSQIYMHNVNYTSCSQ